GSGITATVVLPASTRTEFFEVQRTADGGISVPTGPQQSAHAVARAIVRSVTKPVPEVNMVAPLRIAYGINAFFPALRDLAGRLYFRRSHGRPARRASPAPRQEATQPAETSVRDGSLKWGTDDPSPSPARGSGEGEAAQ